MYTTMHFDSEGHPYPKYPVLAFTTPAATMLPHKCYMVRHPSLGLSRRSRRAAIRIPTRARQNHTEGDVVVRKSGRECDMFIAEKILQHIGTVTNQGNYSSSFFCIF